MDQMTQWKKNSVRLGAPTNLLAALASFLPVLWLCTKYDCWPDPSTVLTGWGLVALSFGALYVVEPVSYYAALGMTGTYLGFLSGNIGNMRLPVAALALDATESEPGTLKAEIVSTLAICGSIFTNLFFTIMAALIGTAIVAVLPELVVSALTKYASAAIFGATFGNFAIKYPQAAAFALLGTLALRMFVNPPAWILIVFAVFGTLLLSRILYTSKQKRVNAK